MTVTATLSPKMTTERLEQVLLAFDHRHHLFTPESPIPGFPVSRHSVTEPRSPPLDPFPHYTSSYASESISAISRSFPHTPNLASESWTFAPDPNNTGHWTTIPQPEQNCDLRTSQSSEWELTTFEFGNPLRIFPGLPYTQAESHHYPSIESNECHTPWTTSSSALSISATSPPMASDEGRIRPEEGAMTAPYPDAQSILSSQTYQEVPSYDGHRGSYSSVSARPKLKQVLSATRHNQSESRATKYRCHFCSEQFSKRSNWADHEKTHDMNRNKIKCPLCNKCYGRAADLARHNRSHHKLDKHSCRFCHKLFNRSDICRRHEADSCRKRGKSEASVTKRRRRTAQNTP